MSRVCGHSISAAGLSMVMVLLLAHDAAGVLYQCRTEGGTVYTDTPEQLKSCTPISQGGGPSNLGLVGVPSTGSAPSAPPLGPTLRCRSLIAGHIHHLCSGTCDLT